MNCCDRVRCYRACNCENEHTASCIEFKEKIEAAKNQALYSRIKQEMDREYNSRFSHLHDEIAKLKDERKERNAHLDGLKYSLNVIEQVELHYKHMGFEFDGEPNPFQDIRNKIRMLLGMPIINR